MRSSAAVVARQLEAAGTVSMKEGTSRRESDERRRASPGLQAPIAAALREKKTAASKGKRELRGKRERVEVWERDWSCGHQEREESRRTVVMRVQGGEGRRRGYGLKRRRRAEFQSNRRKKQGRRKKEKRKKERKKEKKKKEKKRKEKEEK